MQARRGNTAFRPPTMMRRRRSRTNPNDGLFRAPSLQTSVSRALRCRSSPHDELAPPLVRAVIWRIEIEGHDHGRTDCMPGCPSCIRKNRRNGWSIGRPSKASRYLLRRYRERRDASNADGFRSRYRLAGRDRTRSAGHVSTRASECCANYQCHDEETLHHPPPAESRRNHAMSEC